jgi:phospholipase C
MRRYSFGCFTCWRKRSAKRGEDFEPDDNGCQAGQKAYDGELLDQFVENTSATGPGYIANLAVGYCDGSTVTALWSYAQRFAMSDNFFDTEFGTTVMGAPELDFRGHIRT